MTYACPRIVTLGLIVLMNGNRTRITIYGDGLSMLNPHGPITHA